MKREKFILCLDCLWGGQIQVYMNKPQDTNALFCSCCKNNNVIELSEYYEEEDENEEHLFV